jgi:hypothetical protein
MLTWSRLGILILWFFWPAFAQGELQQATDHVVIDGLKIPYGTTIEVSGPCLSTDTFELEIAAASLRTWRLNGRAIQDVIEVELCPDDDGVSYDRLNNLRVDDHYIVHGRLMSARFTGTRNACCIKVQSIEEKRRSPPGFGEFIGRAATFEGTAVKGGSLKSRGEVAKVAGIVEWPPGIWNKEVSIQGIPVKGADGWRIDKAAWRLINLEDQLNQVVSLDGSLWSLNGEWWFNYRNQKLYLTSKEGPTLHFGPRDHGRAVRVNGRLVAQHRPSLEQISKKSDRDLIKCFVIQDSNVEFLDKELNWTQRFGPLYPSFHPIRDGVPELLAEPSFRRNLMGDETDSMLFVERNAEVIESILRDASEKTRNVLAARMVEANVAEPLQLIYAAMLAALNGERGRRFLATKAEVAGNQVDLNALYCLGIVPSLMPGGNQDKTDNGWAEPVLTALISNRKAAESKQKPLIEPFGDGRPLTVADAAAYYSMIPSALATLDSDRARNALLDYVIAGGRKRSEVIQALCGSQLTLPIDDLLRLEAISSDSRDRRAILSQILRHQPLTGLDRFLKDLENGFVYMDLRDHLSPSLRAELDRHVNKLQGQAKVHVQMLLILSEQDPIPKLIALLDDQTWKDKGIVVFELARLGDPRAVAAVARVLHDAPKNFFTTEELAGTSAVQQSLEAIAHAGTTEAIKELISLLSADLSRFGTYIDRSGFQRIVTAHLIELTGESFGTDADGWRKWQQQHPKFYVSRELANPNGAFRTYTGGQIDLGR